MVTHVKSRLLLPAAAALLCLAAPVRSDDLQYLPSNPHFVFSVNFQEVLKSKTFAELKNLVKQFPGAKEDFEAEITKGMGVPAANIARITMGLTFKQGDKVKDSRPESEIGIVSTTKAVTAAEIIAAKKRPKYKVNVTYKEIKVGKFTIHEENFQYQFNEKDKPGEVQKGSLFCVVDDKTVLFSESRIGVEGLQKVLQRNGKPELSKSMQTGLTYAAPTNTGIMVVDMGALPARERENMFRGLSMSGLNDMAGSLEVLAMKANEKAKFEGHASLFCRDAATAAQGKKIVESALVAMKGKLKDDPKIPAPFQDMIKAARESLDAIKVASEGNQVTASISVEPGTVVKLFFGIFAVGGSEPATKEEVKEIKKG